MSDDFNLEATSTATTEATAKSKDDKKQVSIRVPLEVYAAMIDFIDNLTPPMLAKVNAATMTDDGNPQRTQETQFLAFAIRETLKIQDKPRAFGTKIDEYVESVMARNLEVSENRPEDYHEMTAIGWSMLAEDGHNPNSIKRWLAENAERIAAHHAEVGIGTDRFLDRNGNPIPVTGWNRHVGKIRKALQP